MNFSTARVHFSTLLFYIPEIKRVFDNFKFVLVASHIRVFLKKENNLLKLH